MQTAHGLSSAPGASPRPRLLALHGWRTSASVLQQQLKLSGLDAVLREVADVVCMDAPHPARGPPTPDVQRFFSPPFVEWWDAVQDPASGGVTYAGAEASLAALESALRAAAGCGAPVSGLLGFSQGAALAGLVLALQERGERFTDVPPLRCGVLISGSIARDPAFAHLYGSGPGAAAAPDGEDGAAAGVGAAGAPPPPPPLRTASCHLVGAADPMRGRSEQLACSFAAPLLLRHEQGHVVPRLSPEQRAQLAAFLATHLHPPPQPPPQPPRP